MNVTGTISYQLTRWLLGLALGFYYRRIERFHPERAPATGPVMFTANHPNSVTDPFVLGAAVSRRVSFIATVQMFRLAPVKWLLTQCGVIPINRLKDDPKGMRSVLDTFEAVFRVLERGEAVALFPEGITHDDPQLKEVKNGAARMALELEQRHGGQLGLQIVPVGLNFAAKAAYRSDVLVHFGTPIRVTDFLKDYETRRKECIQHLTAEIERRIQELILHLPHLEQGRVVAAVKRLYLDKLRVANRAVGEAPSPQVEELQLTRRIAAAVEWIHQHEPERAAHFTLQLHQYERWLERLNISDATLAEFPNRADRAGRALLWTAIAIAGLPVAIYGWAFRFLPVLLIRWAVRRFAKPKVHQAQTSTAAIVTGVVVFGGFYTFYALVCHLWFGGPISVWFALSLPVASLVAHYYGREVRKLVAALRTSVVLLRAPFAARRLVARRAGLLAEIETAHQMIVSRTAATSAP